MGYTTAFVPLQSEQYALGIRELRLMFYEQVWFYQNLAAAMANEDSEDSRLSSLWDRFYPRIAQRTHNTAASSNPP
jgi:hypothetical protein